MQLVKKIFLTATLMSLYSCGYSTETKGKTTSNTANQIGASVTESNFKNQEIMETTVTENVFSGTFSGSQNGLESSVTFVVKNNNAIGNLVINGKGGKLTGTVSGNTCTGSALDDETAQEFDFLAKINGNQLSFAMILPQYNNQELVLIMTKQDKNSQPKSSKSSNSRDQNLIGTWRFTEILSSGSGEYRVSMSTDYFIQLNSDGSAASWSGSSGGGSSDVSFYDSESSNLVKSSWNTEGKALYLTDHKTKMKEGVYYYVEGNKMMLTGNKKRVYERVN
jgi:hypothetical protein